MRETYTRKLAERIDAVMFLMLIEAIAKRAILLLAASIENPDAERQTLHIDPKLVVLESCGAAR
jgi:DNA-binding LacI/PurR family transcriptional regulator